jgi:glycogen debranching enzyme
VIMLARLGECELAQRNLRSLFAMQEEDGFIGHMVFWQQALPVRRSDVMQARPTWRALRPHMSALIQPCLAAMTLLCLFEADGDRVFLGELYAKVRRYHEWLATHRDFDGDGLITIISPFESGDSMLALMYDENDAAFYDVQEPGARKLRIATPTIFFPLAAPEVPQEIAQRVLDAHFDREDQFGTPCPLPSVERRDAAFYAGETPYLWRGPTWVVNNWFVYYALKSRGFDVRARVLRGAMQGLIERGGFREYYDPYTGEGHGAHDFTWSGLLIDMV